MSTRGSGAEAAPFAARVPRDVVRVGGPDAIGYLQGQLSQDVEGIARGSSAWSFVLQPQGKVDAWVRVTRLADEELLLDVDGGWGSLLATRLERFRLRVRAEIEPLGWECVVVRHVDAAGLAGSAEVVAPVSWAGTVGADLLGPSVAVPAGVPEGTEADYSAWRVEVGFPAMGAEMDEGTIPAEVGVVGISASFTKGCYTGQELVARIDARGANTPRRLRRLRVLEGSVAGGDAVLVDGGRVGVVTTASAGRALAYVGRKVEVGAEAAVAGSGGVVGGRVRVEQLPPPG